MNKIRSWAIALLLAAPVCAAAQPPDTLRGVVLKVKDGDTFTIAVNDSQTTTVRLVNVDAPESKQPHGPEATRFLDSLLTGKTVAVLWRTWDKYDRTLGVVMLDALDVNAELVKRGHAWVYREDGRTDPTDSDAKILTLEAEARKKKIGLWAHPNPVNPHLFRHPEKR